MFERFDVETTQKVRRAAQLADAEGASMVEVEHLFTALVDPPTDSLGRDLTSLGITFDSVRAARDAEFRKALALAGVVTARRAPGGANRLRRGRSTRFALSSKLALERSVTHAVTAGDRRITTAALLKGIVSSEVGIMPRLLAELGVTRPQLEDLAARSP